MEEPERQVVLWPTRDNYAAFVEACDDAVADTYDDFVALAEGRIAELKRAGVLPQDLVLEKLSFDPAAMRRWCRSNCGKVDTQARARYAGWLALQDKRQGDH